MTKDLTVGTPYAVLLKFTLPMIVGSLFQQVYNMADSIIVGRFVGEEALAGVGATGPLNFLIIGFMIGLSSGFAIPIAQAFGAKDYDKIRTFYGNALLLWIGISAVLTTVTLLLLPQILTLMNTPEEIFSHTYSYASTMFMGLAGIFLYNLMAAVMRALGDSKTPLYFLIFASVLNVVLSLVFVLLFDMGVFGTGLATAISQGASGLLCLLRARQKFEILALDRGDFVPRPKVMGRLLAIGLPMGLQISITALGTIAIQSALNSLGAMYVLAASTAMKVHALFTQPLEMLGLAIANFAGQNLGAGKIKRIKQGVGQALLMGAIYSIFCVAVMFFIGEYVAALFVTAPSAELNDAVYLYLMGSSVFYLLLSTLFVVRYTIQGLGFSSQAMMAGIVEMVMRTVVAFALVGTFGYNIIVVSSPLAWVGALLVLIPMYFVVLKKISKAA